MAKKKGRGNFRGSFGSARGLPRRCATSRILCAMSEIQKTVYFVRHGQSEGNVGAEFQGPNSPLSATGHVQAQAVANRLAKIEFEALIASPWARAKETAQVVGKVTGMEPEFSELFIERVKPTSINGKLHTDPVASALCTEWEKSLWTPGMRTEDGENFDDLALRSEKALAFLAARGERSLVVVTHGYIVRTILARVLLGNQFSAPAFKELQQSINLDNTGITALRLVEGLNLPPRWKLWIFNDHAHLG